MSASSCMVSSSFLLFSFILTPPRLLLATSHVSVLSTDRSGGSIDTSTEQAREAGREDGAPPPAGKKKTISVTPPEWWESYSRRMVGLLNDLQRKALHALNTPHDLGRGPPYTEFFGEALPRKRTGEPS